MNNIDEMINQKFNRLLVLEHSSNKWGCKHYRCLCDCGNETIVRGRYLKNGITKSCGCLRKESARKNQKMSVTKRTKGHIDNLTKDVNGFMVKEEYSLEITCFIYKLTNSINKKIYIGKTELSLKKHLRRYNRLINAKNKNRGKRSIDKALLEYGLNNFVFEIVELCTTENANEREIHFISFYKSNDINIGYNLTIGGDGVVGLVFTEEHRNNMSKVRKGKFSGENNPFFGKTHSRETRDKIIESNKRRAIKKIIKAKGE